MKEQELKSQIKSLELKILLTSIVFVSLFGILTLLISNYQDEYTSLLKQKNELLEQQIEWLTKEPKIDTVTTNYKIIVE